jgi:hypothetical protein
LRRKVDAAREVDPMFAEAPEHEIAVILGVYRRTGRSIDQDKPVFVAVWGLTCVSERRNADVNRWVIRELARLDLTELLRSIV